jgi:hypothetical protein
MAYYVKRENRDTGRVGFVGPIRSAKQAGKESDAWVHAGWKAWILESSPTVRAEIRAWERSIKARHA